MPVEPVETTSTPPVQEISSRPVKIFTSDESRFGLMTILRRRITQRGVKPKAAMQHAFDNTYLYGAVAPMSGESCFLELPRLDTTCFQIFIDHLARAFPATLNIVVLDNGSFHKAKKLKRPSNVRFVFTPPYTPEVNPIERVWEDFKAQLAGEVFDVLDALSDRLVTIIQSTLPSKLSSLTSFPFFRKVCNAIR